MLSHAFTLKSISLLVILLKSLLNSFSFIFSQLIKHRKSIRIDDWLLNKCITITRNVAYVPICVCVRANLLTEINVAVYILTSE